MDNASL